MPRGGARPGAGRPRNSPNKASQQRQAEVAASGDTPLEVLLAAMRKAYAENDLPAACRYAAAAAPYVHPKLSAIERTGKDGEPLLNSETPSMTARAILSWLYDESTAEQKANELGLNEEPEAAPRLREPSVAGSSPARAAGGSALPAAKPDDDEPEGLGGVEILDPSLPHWQGLNPPSEPTIPPMSNGAIIGQNAEGKFEIYDKNGALHGIRKDVEAALVLARNIP